MLSRQYSALSSKNEEDREEIFGKEDLNDGLEDLLHCITCGKNFKNMKQLVNHEDSRKHKENVALIASQLNGVNLDSGEEKEKGKDYKIQNKVKIECGMNASENPLFGERNRFMHSSISSVSLPDDNTLKTLEIVEGLENELDNEFFVEPPSLNGSTENRQPTLDSLLYMKIKEIKNRRCSLPVKDKLSKSPNYSKFMDDEEYNEEENLLPQDSLILPRTRSKKLQADNRTMKRSVTDGNLQAGFGKSSITDSLRILKKRTAAEGGKIRRKLFGRDSATCTDTLPERN